jgi:alpha-L-fucosidase
MKYFKFLLIVLGLAASPHFLSTPARSQDVLVEAKPVASTAKEKTPAEKEWDEIAAKWTTPEWIQDAKFGLWAHWGPQSVPRLGGGWYARHMYMPDVSKERWGRNAYSHHVETYGHPSEFGYKDLIHHHFKAEKFDADALVRQFKDWGARYVAIIANHHENFDLYPTSVHDWNSVKVGPRRDLLGEFAAAAKKQNLPWVATVHVGRMFFPPAGTSDKDGLKSGVPYDLAQTKADGKGKWWEGLDPRQLYGQPKDIDIRTMELIENYDPDMLYFDRSFLPFRERWMLTEYYRRSLAKHGYIKAIITVKKPAIGAMLDVERGQLDSVQDFVWQTDTTMFNGWFRKEDEGDKNLRYDTRCLVEMLTDIVSKNGVMLLNVALYADGSIPQDQAKEIQGLADWLKIHGEAVYTTRPWKIHGVGGQTRKGHFSERTRYDSQPWGSDVIRFTRSKDNKTLYVFIYGAKPGEALTIEPLQKGGLLESKIESISLMGSDARLDYDIRSEGLKTTLPAKLASPIASVLKIQTAGL